MKKIHILALILLFMLVGCNPNSNSIEKPVDMIGYWNENFTDNSNQITKNRIDEVKVFYDGCYLTEEKELVKRKDIKYEFYTDSQLRFVNSSEGYAITIPSQEVSIDYTISNYRVQLAFEDCILSASYEDSNPYGSSISSWKTYLTEWVNRYIDNPVYLEQNDLEYTTEVIDSTDILKGYQVLKYSILIKDNEEVKMPYYNIGIVREEKTYNRFFLFVMKSKVDESNSFLEMLKSFKGFTSFGVSKNHQTQYELKANPKWNDETKAYFDKLNDEETFDFGFFNCSLNDDTYDYIDQKLSTEINRLEELTNYKQKILPTYNHLSWYETPHRFPLLLANKYGGGNGFDDKAVLQFTLQYTKNNNNVNTANKTENYTPMFDILRGKYDIQFRELAKDIKAYGKPVLFRLNNEMNSDWTSYCGLITLLDPDIFQYTWIRLYEIFEEEGVDNCIWIFNPIAVTCPYSSWGEDLCYMPGTEYVQALGITRYEMLNDDVEAKSFEEGYTILYAKNKPYWMNYPWIVSEFGCASGGEITEGGVLRELYGNRSKQAEWVRGMFDCLKDKENNDFCSKITAAVWFNCNDYYYDENGNTLIMNALHLDSSLTETFEALKEGLSYFSR